MIKNKWYWGVHEDCFLAVWTGSNFATIKDNKNVYFNHKEDFAAGFEPLAEVQKIGSGFIWCHRDFNQRIYKCTP